MCHYREFESKASSAEKKNKQGGVYIGMEGDFWLARQGKKRAGLLVWAEKVFSYFLFYKKIQQIRFEFKLNKFKFKSNHKQ